MGLDKFDYKFLFFLMALLLSLFIVQGQDGHNGSDIRINDPLNNSSLGGCPVIDSDCDGIFNEIDNCPLKSNPDQWDSDKLWKRVGCSWYPDLKGIPLYCFDWEKNKNDPKCKLLYKGDGVGDACDTCPMIMGSPIDSDGDLLGDNCDNCPKDKNPDQEDDDGDCLGNLCDNCPNIWNPDQSDVNKNGIGDSCECQDAFQGPNEDGIDCGGFCPACLGVPAGWTDLEPIRVKGNPIDCIDIVFVPEKGYSYDPIGFACDAHGIHGTEYIVYRSKDDHIIELWSSDGSTWNLKDLTKDMPYAPSASGNPSSYISQFKGHAHIIYPIYASAHTGKENHIYDLETAGPGFQWWWIRDLNIKNNVPQFPEANLYSGTPSGYTWEKKGTEHVVYKGDFFSHRINMLWSSDGKNWNHIDLTKVSNAKTLANGELSGFAWEENSTEHIVYLGGDGHIHQLWSADNQNWKDMDLTLLMLSKGAPQISQYDPSAYIWKQTRHGSERIVYRGNDDHIHELWSKDGKDWNYKDLTLNSAAPLAAGDPSGYAWNWRNTAHAVYRSKDDHIIELSSSDGSTWKYRDLTNDLNAPLASGYDAFRKDVIKIIGNGFFKLDKEVEDIALPANYRDMFNFYIYTGGFGSIPIPDLPKNRFPKRDIVALLCNNERGNGVSSMGNLPGNLKAPARFPGKVIHEFGHGIFGLPDGCADNPADSPSCTMVNSGSSTTFGPVCSQKIAGVFNNWPQVQATWKEN